MPFLISLALIAILSWVDVIFARFVEKIRSLTSKALKIWEED